jgi:hypothetical protein
MGFRKPNTGKTGPDISIVLIVHSPQRNIAGSTASYYIPNDLSQRRKVEVMIRATRFTVTTALEDCEF